MDVASSRSCLCVDASRRRSARHAASDAGLGMRGQLLGERGSVCSDCGSSARRIATFQYAAWSVCSQMLRRPLAGGVAASVALTPRREPRSVGPCQPRPLNAPVSSGSIMSAGDGLERVGMMSSEACGAWDV